MKEAWASSFSSVLLVPNSPGACLGPRIEGHRGPGSRADVEKPAVRATPLFINPPKLTGSTCLHPTYKVTQLSCPCPSLLHPWGQ